MWVCCLKFSDQLGETLHDVGVVPRETVAVLMPMGDEDAIHPHGGSGFGVVRGVADINHIFWAMGQVG